MNKGMFLVKSGPGYLIKIVNGSNEMITDPSAATKYDYETAVAKQKLLIDLGLSVELVRSK